ncbi:hypothetical protein V8F33_007961 [Rhypophila sp. PSN 637]
MIKGPSHRSHIFCSLLTILSKVLKAPPKTAKMPARLVIPPCGDNPKHRHHLPPEDQPLRVSIIGLNTEFERLFPDSPKLPAGPDCTACSGNRGEAQRTFHEIGPLLAKLVFANLYGRDSNDEIPDDLVLRDEGHGWALKRGEAGENRITHYILTFDHLVPSTDDDDPEVLQLNLFVPSDAQYSKISLIQYFEDDDCVVLVPRCCQVRKGTTDRGRVNDAVKERKARTRGQVQEV